MSRLLFPLAAAVALAWLAPLGCSASRATGTGVGGAAASSSTASTASSAGIGGFTSASSGGGAPGTGGGCAASSTKAAPIPLDIFVMLDQSGSMIDDAGNGMTKWQTVKAALTTFMAQPDTAGIGMGIQYFGLPQPNVPGCAQISCVTDADCTGGCTTCIPQGICQSQFNPDIDSCDAPDYAWADVAIQPLPGVSAAILGSIGMHAPGTNTPTSPALQGAIDYAQAWQAKHPTHLTVVAFATDGEPSECDTDLTHIEAIAAAGFSGAPSIKTFVIGVGGALQNLDGLAAAGGTTSAFHVDMSAAATQGLVDAMNTIRGAALGCTYQIPPPAPGMTEDFDRINVVYKPGGGAPKDLPRVQDKAHCPAGVDAWYYDDDAAPTEIILCGATCATVAMDSKAEVDVLLGCLTIVK